MFEYIKGHQTGGMYYSRKEICALAEQFGIMPVRAGKRIPRDTLLFLELAVLMELLTAAQIGLPSSPPRIEAWRSRIRFRLTLWSGGGFEHCT